VLALPEEQKDADGHITRIFNDTVEVSHVKYTLLVLAVFDFGAQTP